MSKSMVYRLAIGFSYKNYRNIYYDQFTEIQQFFCEGGKAILNGYAENRIGGI